MTRCPVPRRNAEAGLTLVEMLVALAVLALIGAAGMTMLDGILRAQARTDGRMESLARMQRVLHLVAMDFSQAANRSVVLSDTVLTFRRAGGPALAYALEEGALVRRLFKDGGTAREQVLLPGTDALRWRFFVPGTGWVAQWPPGSDPARTGGGMEGRANPAAIELELSLGVPGLAGRLRRVAILPAEALP